MCSLKRSYRPLLLHSLIRNGYRVNYKGVKLLLLSEAYVRLHSRFRMNGAVILLPFNGMHRVTVLYLLLQWPSMSYVPHYCTLLLLIRVVCLKFITAMVYSLYKFFVSRYSLLHFLPVIHILCLTFLITPLCNRWIYFRFIIGCWGYTLDREDSVS
jgi:hypothetical protein